MSTNPSVKILVGYHKKDKLLKDEILVPIHLGRALATEASKDGEMSQEDYQWMLENMIGDDTGENISHLNRIFNEMTGIYWAWKNYDKLGNPDYIGFMHYRRLFIFDMSILEQQVDNGNGCYKVRRWNDVNIDSYKNSISSILKKDTVCDIMIPQARKQDISVKTQFLESHPHLENNLNILLKILDENKQYKDISQKYFEGKEQYCYNMFIMKREEFFHYSDFIFNILFNLYHQVTKLPEFDKYNVNDLRSVAFLSERLSGIYFKSQIHKYKNDYKELPIAFIESTQETVMPYYSENNIPIVMTTDENFVPYVAVTIQSIVKNSSSKNNYDIVVLHDGIYEISKKRLLEVIQAKNNFIIRYIDIRPYIENYTLKSRLRHISKATFYRYVIPDVMPQYKKAVYLDTDTVVLKDIASLYNQNIEGFYFGACHDVIIMQNIELGKNKLDYFENIVNIKNPYDYYFQAGVLLFNIELMRQDNIVKSMLETAQEGIYIYSGQDPMNKVCWKKTKFISYEWNFTNFIVEEGSIQKIPNKYYEMYIQTSSSPAIIHYASHIKPWNTPNSYKASEWWKYAKETQYYEEIIYKNATKRIIQKVNENIDIEIIKEAFHYGKSKIKYWRYKILSKLTWGKKKKRYRQKRIELKHKLRQIRKFLKI